MVEQASPWRIFYSPRDQSPSEEGKRPQRTMGEGRWKAVSREYSELQEPLHFGRFDSALALAPNGRLAVMSLPVATVARKNGNNTGPTRSMDLSLRLGQVRKTPTPIGHSIRFRTNTCLLIWSTGLQGHFSTLRWRQFRILVLG